MENVPQNIFLCTKTCLALLAAHQLVLGATPSPYGEHRTAALSRCLSPQTSGDSSTPRGSCSPGAWGDTATLGVSLEDSSTAGRPCSADLGAGKHCQSTQVTLPAAKNLQAPAPKAPRQLTGREWDPAGARSKAELPAAGRAALSPQQADGDSGSTLPVGTAGCCATSRGSADTARSRSLALAEPPGR